MCDAITLPGGLPIWALAPILLAALLALGILILIIIKILFVILVRVCVCVCVLVCVSVPFSPQDYIEVKKWEKEAKDADFSKVGHLCSSQSVAHGKQQT